MYPFLRLGTHAIKSAIKQKQGHSLQLTDTSEITLTANINDIDNFFEMNNGRIFTLFDLGRNDLAIRSGLAKKLFKHRWGLVVAGSTIQYRVKAWSDADKIRPFPKANAYLAKDSAITE